MSWFDHSLIPSGVLVLIAFLGHEFLAGLIRAVAHDAWHVVKTRLRRAGRRLAGLRDRRDRRRASGPCGPTSS